LGSSGGKRIGSSPKELAMNEGFKGARETASAKKYRFFFFKIRSILYFLIDRFKKD
jgi:hypothetical protein